MEKERLIEYIKREPQETCSTIRRWASAWFAVGEKKGKEQDYLRKILEMLAAGNCVRLQSKSGLPVDIGSVWGEKNEWVGTFYCAYNSIRFLNIDIEPKVCDKAKYPWENIFEPEEAKQLHGLGIL